MECEFCEFARECKDPAQYGGGCDIDGVDEFGCGTVNEDDEDQEMEVADESD